MKNSPEGGEDFSVDGRTDMKKLLLNYCNFANTLKNGKWHRGESYTGIKRNLMKWGRGAGIVDRGVEVRYNEGTKSGPSTGRLI